MSKPKSQISKGQFIRNHLHLSPKETIEKAKAEGITLTAGAVYTIRFQAKKKGLIAGPKPMDESFARAWRDDELRQKIIRYGTATVREVLDALERGE